MTEVFFNGPAGRIEGRYQSGEVDDAPISLVLHPHPQYGGSMHNKVVYNMHKAFVDNGFAALRINFRGVGKSSGSFDPKTAAGELLSDAAVALDWLHSRHRNAKSIWVAGFSFGAWVATQLIMRRPEVKKFIIISLPANKYDLTFLSPCPASGLIVHGDQDSISDENSISKFVDKITASPLGRHTVYQVVTGADHFFRDKADRVYEIANRYISATILDKPMSSESKITSESREEQRVT